MTNPFCATLLGRSRHSVALLLVLLSTQYLPATTPTPPPVCPGRTYVQDDSAGDGLIVMEAEHPTRRDSSTYPGHGTNIRWREYTTTTASNGAYVRVADSSRHDYDQPPRGATLEYDIDFTTTGTYYIRARHWSPNGESNSVNVALDGTVIEPDWNLDFHQKDWHWNRAIRSFQVTTTGTHTLTIYHRESGLYLDKLLISKQENHPVTGFGPAATEAGTYSEPTRTYEDLTGYHVDYRTGEGFTVIETEAYTNKVAGIKKYACREWTTLTDSSASGESYMVVNNLNQRSDTTNLWTAPRLDYEIRTSRPDTHYVHIRHRSTIDDNSVWLGVNYKLAVDWHLEKDSADWIWQSYKLGYIAPRAGKYLLSVLMREDGTPIDKIIITTDPTYSPTGEGPHTTDVQSPGLTYYQKETGNHEVALPLERPSRNLAGIGQYEDLRWKYYADPDALNETYAVVDNAEGYHINAKDGTSAGTPTLEFDIQFNQVGTHFMYVRHRATDGSDNSFTYYLNGKKIKEQHLEQYSTNGEWLYYDDLPTLQIDSAGTYTLGIAMREDGTQLDHLILSTSPSLMAEAMPVELLDFAARPAGTTNQITWTTVHEDLTAYHIVERSASARSDWEEVSTLAAAGYSQQTLSYETVDPSPLPVAYYRLRTVDEDGSSSLSRIVRVVRAMTPPTTAGLSVFPNPAAGHTTVRYEYPSGGPVHFRLLSLTGRTLLSRAETAQGGTNEFTLDLSTLSSGTYLLTGELPELGRITRRIMVR